MDLSSDETSLLGDELFLVAPREAPQSSRLVRPSPRRPRAISTGQEESHFASGSSLMMSNSFPSYYSTGASYAHTIADARPILPIVSPTKVRVARRPRHESGGDASVDDPPSIQNISLVGEVENLHNAFAPIRDDLDDLEDRTESRRIPTIGLRPRALKRPIDDFNSCGAREADEDDGC